MHHPIYSSGLQSPPCQPLAERDDGQTPPVHKLCKGNKCTQQTAPDVWPAWPWGSSCPVTEGLGTRGGPTVQQGQWQHSMDQLDERKKGERGWKGSKPCSGVVYLCSTYPCVCVCVCRTHSALAHSAPIRQLVCRGDARKGEERCLLLRVETELEQLHVVPLPEGQPRHCSHTATRALMCSFTFLDASSPRGAKAQGVSISCSLTATHGWRAHFGNRS